MTALAIRGRHATDLSVDPSWDISTAALSLAEALRTARSHGYTTPAGDVRVTNRKVTAPLSYTGVLQWQQLLTKPRIRQADARYLHVTGHIGDTEWHLHTAGGTP